MRSRATLFWIFLAALVGFGLFHVKYKVQELEEELGRLNADIMREQESLHVLRAEWAFLNRPERLEDLNTRFLHLGPLTPAQIGGLDDLPARAPDAPTENAP